MPQITKISPQKRKKRVNVFIDGKFAFGADLETLAKHNLQVGQKISQKKIEEIIKESEFQKVYDRTLKFLSFRPRSEKEVRDWLNKKKTGEETKRIVIKKLKETKLLDDREFASWWIEQRVTFRPIGKAGLKYELRKKGVEGEIVDEALEKKITDSFERKLALKVAKKKSPAYQKLPPLEFRQKMGGFLARRGFSWEVIKEVIDKISSSVLTPRSSL